MEARPVPRLVLASAGRGAGKTTVAIGLAAALRRRGRTVQTFKVGLDTHDAGYLAHVTGRPCRNLDTWILGGAGVLRSVHQGMAGGADSAIVEGALGLFDGHGSRRGDGAHPFPGSTAEIAALLGAPVVVVIDAALSGETAAAVALGMRTIDPSLRLVGAILDGAPSEEHRERVEDAVWRHARLPVLGALAHVDEMRIPQWGHGLVPVAENASVDAAVDHLAGAVERHCDLDLVLRLMTSADPLPAATPVPRLQPPSGPRLRLGVAYDEAFCSYYAENLELLGDAGAEIMPFSPLEETALPDGVDALYLGGGCLEVHCQRLAANRPLAAAVARAHSRGMPVYAEGGGVLWAARRLRVPDGSEHAMAGLLPIDIEVDGQEPQSAYRELRLEDDCLVGPAGTVLRGHEYWATASLHCGDPAPLAAMHDSDGAPLGCDGWRSPTMAASLVQLHFGQDPAVPARLVAGLTAAARRRVPARA